MRIVARRRSEVADPRWRADVLQRKMTIAEGISIVHGKKYDIEANFGIGLEPFDTPIDQNEMVLT